MIVAAAKRWLLPAALLTAAPLHEAEAKRRPATTEPSEVRHQGPIARVLSETAEVRSGAGFGFRVIAVVRRDDTVRMIERGKRGGWTRVQLDSGVVGWILSEQILLLTTGTGDEEKPGPFRRFGRKLREKVLGPPNLLTARIGGTLSAGALGREGLFLVRPQVFLSPNVGIEGYVGPSAGRETSRGIMGAAGNLYLSPAIPFTLFISVGAGAVFTKGKVDTLTSARWSYLMSPGGGVWIIFKRGIGIRFDFRNHVLFRADDAQSLREYTGALSFTF
jgi:Bacterial SH3 domain